MIATQDLDEVEQILAAAQPSMPALVLPPRGAYVRDLLHDYEYKGPFSSEQLLPALRECWPAALYSHETKTGIVYHQDRNIRAEYGATVLHVVADPHITSGCYDGQARTLRLPCWQRAQLDPEFCAEVDAWLRLLGGAMAEKLLDWIATILQIDKQQTILDLRGEPDTGKSLLATALAALWVGGHLTLEEVSQRFNYRLIETPLVVGDERIPDNLHSTDLRRLIGNSLHKVEPKFGTPATLNGSVRMILTSNAPVRFEGENHGKDDVDAIAQRFLRINAGEAPRDYLKSLPEGTISRWLEEKTVARHALWLESARTVVPGSRFLVEAGALDATAQELATGGNDQTELICEWLVRCLDALATGTKVASSRVGLVAGDDRIKIGNSKVLIAASAVVDHWDAFINSRRWVPTANRVGNVLGTLAVGKQRTNTPSGKHRYYELRVDWLLGTAERYGFVSDRLKTFIDT